MRKLWTVPNLVSEQKENIKSLDKEEGLEKSELYSKNQKTCNMNMHPVESVHEGKKPFRCSMCDYSCSEIDLMKSHMIMHPVESVYECNKSNKCSSFDANSNSLVLPEMGQTIQLQSSQSQQQQQIVQSQTQTTTMQSQSQHQSQQQTQQQSQGQQQKQQQQQVIQQRPQAAVAQQQVQLVAMRVSNDMANRQFCLSWLKATYETQTDNFTLSIEQKLMYKQYLASLYKMGVKDVISAQQYAMCVR